MAKRKTKRSKGKIRSFFGALFGALWRVFPFIAVLTVLAGAGYGVTVLVGSESELTVKSIRLVPGDSLVPQDLERLESKLMGKRLLDLDLKAISRELEKDIRIDRAVVKREFPSTVVIDIRRREPFAVIRYREDGPWFWASRDGMILDEAPVLDESWLKIWETGGVSQRKNIGNKIQNPAFYKLPALVDSFQNHKLAEAFRIAGFAIDQEGNISMRFHNGLLVKLMLHDIPGTDLWQKLVLVLENEEPSAIEYIDLRYDRVFVKRKAAA